MVNRVVPRDELAARDDGAGRQHRADAAASASPSTKKAVNQVEDLMGLQAGMDSVFGLHHLAHAHNAEVSGGDSLGGQTIKSMK